MKSTNFEGELGVGGKFVFDFFFFKSELFRGFDSCDIALIHVSYYGKKKQRKVVLGAYEMHYFKLTAVRNCIFPSRL